MRRILIGILIALPLLFVAVVAVVRVMQSPRPDSRRASSGSEGVTTSDRIGATPSDHAASISRKGQTLLGKKTHSPEELRWLLRSGTRVDKLFGLDLMVAYDRNASAGKYREDIREAVSDSDMVVAAKAVEVLLQYYRSELFPGPHPVVGSPQLAIATIEYYSNFGNFTAKRLNDDPMVSVRMLSVAMMLAKSFPTTAVLSSFENAYEKLKEKDDLRSALRIGIFLANHGNFTAADFALTNITSKDSHVVLDAVDILRIKGDPAVVPQLKTVYGAQDKHAMSKEVILHTIAELWPEGAYEYFLELLPNEPHPSRRQQLVYLLSKSGRSKESIVGHLFSHSNTPNGQINLTAARALLDLGDRTILSNLRGELERVMLENPDSLYGKEVVRLLGEARDSSSIPQLGRLLTQSSDPVLRLYAKKALENIPDPQAGVWLRASKQ